MDKIESLNHTKWDCKCHVVFIPKGRRKVLYGQLSPHRCSAKNNDVMRYARSAFTTKEARNQNMADAFYQGGHSQTAIALAFNVSGSTVSRVVLRYEPGK